MSAINICQNICGNENVLWCGYCCAVVWLAWAVAGQLLLVLIMGPGQAVIDPWTSMSGTPFSSAIRASARRKSV